MFGPNAASNGRSRCRRPEACHELLHTHQLRGRQAVTHKLAFSPYCSFAATATIDTAVAARPMCTWFGLAGDTRLPQDYAFSRFRLRITKQCTPALGLPVRDRHVLGSGGVIENVTRSISCNAYAGPKPFDGTGRNFGRLDRVRTDAARRHSSRAVRRRA